MFEGMNMMELLASQLKAMKYMYTYVYGSESIPFSEEKRIAVATYHLCALLKFHYVQLTYPLLHILIFPHLILNTLDYLYPFFLK